MSRLRWVLAVMAAILTTIFVLRPWGARPEDLQLEVTSVRTLSTAPQKVEVKVRWRWTERHPAPGARDLIAIGVDPGRWLVHDPSPYTRPDETLLNLLGQPTAMYAIQVKPGEDGELTAIITARDKGYRFEASAIPLRVHYLRRAPEDWSPPGSSWVRTVESTYALGSSTH